MVWIKKHPVITYFILAYIVSWAFALPLVLSEQGLVSAQITPNWHITVALGPMVSALIVTGLVKGRSGYIDLFRRLIKWRVGILWVLIAFLSPFLLFGLSYALLPAFGSGYPDLSGFGQTETFISYNWTFSLVFTSFAFGLGEETGWRGFALPRLQSRYNALISTIILAVFWALWHLPMFFYRQNYMGMNAFMIFGFFFSIVVGAVVLTWLYNSSKGSILIVAVWHFNWNIVNISASAIDDNLLMIMSLMIIAAAVIIVLTVGYKNLSRVARHQIETEPG